MRAPLLPWYPLRLWHWVIWSFVGGAVLLSAALVEVFCTWAIGLILRLKFVSCGLMVFSISHEAASKSSPHMAPRMRSMALFLLGTMSENMYVSAPRIIITTATIAPSHIKSLILPPAILAKESLPPKVWGSPGRGSSGV